MKFVALVARNSLHYIENVFSLNESLQPLINISDESAIGSLTGIDIERCIVPDEGGGWFTAHHPLIHADLPAQVTYTSGTEGKPKGIVLSYANLADAAERIIDQMGLTAAVREYVGVPVTYSFGIARIRAVSAVGGRSYLPSRGFDPLELSRMLKSGEVNALSAVPTLLRILLQTQTKAVIGDAGANLRWLEIGSQYMSAAEKRGIRELFPNARIVQHYGLTEASRSTFLQISNVPDDVLESVGKAVGQTEVAISPEGRILIRGPHVARWRVDADADALQGLCNADGWLETNDLGHIEDGYLYYDGRADDLINIGGVKINPDTLEARIGQILGLGGRIAATKVPDALRGEGVLVAAEASDITADQLRSGAAEALKELGIAAGDALHAKVVSAIPRTATGKPLRRLLAEEYLEEAKAAAPAPGVEQGVPAEARDVHAFFRQFFPGRRIGPQDSFESMGGDSLNYIQFSLEFESRFGPLPDGWEALTIDQLETTAATSERGRWPRLDPATLTRAFFMICIVAEHLDTFIYSKNWGAAYFLFMLCGYSVIRFQWPTISRTGKISTIFGTVFDVAIPTILVIAFMQTWARTFEPKPLLLISNWFDPRQYHIAYYYFAEIYIQLLLVVAGMLSFSRAREALGKNPMLFCTIFVAIATVISWMVERVWDTNYLFHRTPIWYLWTVAAGMLMASARDTQSRIYALLVVSIAVLMHHHYTSASAYIIGASAILLFGSAIRVPSIVKSLISEVAGSSMFMYLSHAQVRSIVIRLFHGPRPWIAFYAAIAFGIVFAHVYHWIERKVRAFLSTRHGKANAAGIPQDALLHG
ncbi:AMP-binding protein [Novosphingobium sp. BL-8A]